MDWYNCVVRNSEEQAWSILSGLDPAEVCTRAKVEYCAPSGSYLLRSFLAEIIICKADRTLISRSPVGTFLLNELGDYFRLSTLWYLVMAKNVPLSGELINPSHFPGGEIFRKGTHALPLETISAKYGNNIGGFLEAGRNIGGEEVGYANAAVKLTPFPRVPVLILLWQADSEFPAHSEVLLDSTCQVHIPIDIMWATTMVSTQLILRYCRPV